jgi:hypothetical protein
MMDCPECFHRTSRHNEVGCQASVPVYAFPITSLPCPCPLDSEGRRTSPVVPRPPLGEVRALD